MRLGRTVALSRRAFSRHPVRTGLAVAGTAMGVAAVVATVAVGRGAEREVADRIDALGRDLLMVHAGDLEQTPTRPGTAGVKVTTLRQADGDAIRRMPSVIAVAPSHDQDLRLKYGTVSTTANVRGTTPDFEEIRNFRTVAGRYFTDEENAAAMRVAVIGAQVRDVLFPDANPLGAWIRVGRVPFRVIGVLERKGVTVGGAATEDDKILIPINTAMRRLFNVDWLKMIYVQVAGAEAMEPVGAAIAALLRQRHDLDRRGKGDDFVVENPRVLLAAQTEAAAAFRRMITGLGGVALVVSGVGVLSLMTLSVRERRGEVGVRMAVGARRRDIRVQFLAEALAVTAAGGVAGLALGSAAVFAIARWTEWHAVPSALAALLALGSALFVGGTVGVYPAHRAASCHPVTALRAE